MTIPPPDGSRDARIDDPTNQWLIHPAGRTLLTAAIWWGVPANAVSVIGVACGAAAAWSYIHWTDWRWASAGFVLSIAWLVADGLDGMIARAQGMSSEFGRFLDGLCDHAVFLLLYLSLAGSLGTAEAWALAGAAGSAHAVQATLYEGERMRYHRRINGNPGTPADGRLGNVLVRCYDAVATSLDRYAEPFDRCLRTSADPKQFAETYGSRAAPPLKLMTLLSNNMRVLAIYLACLVEDPRLFWWVELIPMSAIAAGGIWWHRRVERALIRETRELAS